MASVKLIITEDDNSEIRQSYDMTIEASEPVDIEPEIFVIQRAAAPAIVIDVPPADQFTSVADPLDMEEYPTDPVAYPSIPFYRVSMVALRFRSYSLMQETKANIISDVNGLLYAINMALSYPVTEEIVIDGSNT